MAKNYVTITRREGQQAKVSYGSDQVDYDGSGVFKAKDPSNIASANLPPPPRPNSVVAKTDATGKEVVNSQGKAVFTTAKDAGKDKPLPSAFITVTTRAGNKATLQRSPYAGNYQDYDRDINDPNAKPVGKPYRIEDGVKIPVDVVVPNPANVRIRESNLFPNASNSKQEVKTTIQPLSKPNVLNYTDLYANPGFVLQNAMTRETYQKPQNSQTKTAWNTLQNQIAAVYPSFWMGNNPRSDVSFKEYQSDLNNMLNALGTGKMPWDKIFTDKKVSLKDLPLFKWASPKEFANRVGSPTEDVANRALLPLNYYLRTVSEAEKLRSRGEALAYTQDQQMKDIEAAQTALGEINKRQEANKPTMDTQLALIKTAQDEIGKNVTYERYIDILSNLNAQNITTTEKGGKVYFGSKLLDDNSAYEQYQKIINGLQNKGISVTTEKTTEGTELLNFNSKELQTANLPMYYKIIEQSKVNGKSTSETTQLRAMYLGTRISEAVAIGLVLKEIGVIDTIGRGLGYLWQTGKVAKVTITAASVGLPAWDIYAKTTTGARSYEQLKMNKIEGAVEGASLAVGQLVGGFMGATNFKYSPIKYQAFGGEDSTNIRTLYLNNPFGKGTYPLATMTKGNMWTNYEPQFSFGYPKTFLQGNNLNTINFGDLTSKDLNGFEPMSKIQLAFYKHYFNPSVQPSMSTDYIAAMRTLKLTNQLKDVKILSENQIPFEKGRAFNELNEQQQKAFMDNLIGLGKGQKGLKGFWNALTNRGLERIYGSSTISAEGGFKTNAERIKGEFGDFDLNFRNEALPQAQKIFADLSKFGKNVRLQAGSSLIEVQSSKGQWIHLADLHGSDFPELMLQGDVLGIPSKGTKTYWLDQNTIKGSQLSQSMVEKAGSTLELRQSMKGLYYVSPPSHRLKDIGDTISIMERLNQVSNKNLNAEIESTKNIYKVVFGKDVKFNNPIGFFEGSFGTKSLNFPSVSIPKDTVKASSSIAKMKKMIEADIGNAQSRASKAPSFNSLYASMSRSINQSLYPSPSPSRSPSLGASPSLYPSPSRSPSQSPSKGSQYPSPSPSRQSPSRSPSPSPSMSPSMSMSPSPSPSPYPSPSPSRSPSPSMTPSQWSSYFGMPSLNIGGGMRQEMRIARGKKRKVAGYIPDFTAKQLGITMKATNKNLKKLLKAEFTGLEIARPGVVFR